MRLHAVVDVDPDGAVVIQTERWRKHLPTERRADVVRAFAALLDVSAEDLHDHDPMEKAVRPMGEQPDPRYGELLSLIEAARKDWDTWGTKLTRRVIKLLDQGHLLPLSADTQAVLRALFDDHRMAVAVTFLGPGAAGVPAAKLEQLIRSGLVDRSVAERGGYVELAYRLGRGLNTLRQHDRPARDREVSLGAALEEALKTKIDARDRKAVDYARKRVGELIRIPLARPAVQLDRVLTDEEAGSLRAAVAEHVEEGGTERLKRDIQEAIKGTRITNDLDRIIRTELQFAHSYGAYKTLKEQAKTELGEDDPLVYRVASIGACTHCLRLWGQPTSPRRYRLSELEKWEAQGGNFGLPAAEWGPTIGPVHPQCCCSPVAYFNEEAEDAIAKAVENIMRAAGGGRTR